MVCDSDKRNTELIKALVVDSGTFEPLEAVQVDFQYRNRTLRHGANQIIPANLKVISCGIWRRGKFLKDDYLVNFYPIDTYRYEAARV